MSGGYSTAIYDNVRKAIEASKHVMFGSTDTQAKAIDFRQAFFLATLGGAQVMSLDKKIGEHYAQNFCHQEILTKDLTWLAFLSNYRLWKIDQRLGRMKDSTISYDKNLDVFVY